MKPVRIFQHEGWIGGGRVLETLTQRDMPFEIVSIESGDPVPAPSMTSRRWSSLAAP
ncbi:hypothetical protein [Methyloceanibacter superfactus]|uniref:hypothetical protein n=1 Tax=Methyloceanibacter superfactus TaxID=1774969 RepID=UPI0013018BD0|nr:hypothetical protein [Methyloceanibacter superfactus]